MKKIIDDGEFNTIRYVTHEKKSMRIVISV